MPARWGLQQTHPGLQAATRRGAGILYKNLKKKRTVHLNRFLLRQGEPGMSQYVFFHERISDTFGYAIWMLGHLHLNVLNVQLWRSGSLRQSTLSRQIN